MNNKLRTEWDLSLVFKSLREAEQSRSRSVKAADYFRKKWEKRSDYLKDPEILCKALNDYELLMRDFGANHGESYYYWLEYSLRQNSPEIKARLNKAEEASRSVYNTFSFFPLRIAKIAKAERRHFLRHPKLSAYRYFFKCIFRESDHLLSEPEERLMVLKSSSAMENWVKMTEEFLAKEIAEIISESGKKEKKPFSELPKLLESFKKKTRDSAAGEINRVLEKWSDVAEAEINSIFGDKKVNDELRKMPRPDSARYLSDGIDADIADAMTKAVSESFYLSKKFYAFRAKLEGLKQLEYWERNIPYGKIGKKYSYEDAIRMVREVFSGLDPEFVGILDKFVSRGQIDVYPKQGKTSGAFCSHGRITDCVYVLLNHNGTVNDVLTLAHEMGHAINSELMKKQNALNFGTSYFVAETASTFMEDFVLEALMKNIDEESRLALMVEKLKNEVSTIFRQIACANFERELHKEFRRSGYLSKKEIGRIFKEHMASYMGSAIRLSSGAENWWVYWSHIRQFFYTYSYASGLLISKKLQAGVRKNSDYISEVKNFLSAGLSDSPKNIFKNIGADVSRPDFWKEGLAEFADLLNKTEKLAKKLGKIK